MNYDQLIRNWHTKADDEDFFSKFVFEYLAFIAHLKRRRFIDANTDRSAIQRLKQDEAIKREYLNHVESDQQVKRAWQRIMDELTRARLANASRSDEVEEIRWWNCAHDRLEQKTFEENERPMGVITGLKDWENMVEFWYSIRNNLFHGSKDPQDDRDRLLVENGYKTLRPLVSLLLIAQPQ